MSIELDTIENLEKLPDKLKILNNNKDLAVFVELFQINQGIKSLLGKEVSEVDFSVTNELLQKLIDKEDEIEITLTLE